MNTRPTSRNLVDAFLKRIELVPTSDRFILRILFFAVIGSLVYFALTVNNDNATLVATRGGIIREAVLGTPRFVNPALAITRADQDITALVYSGLMKLSPDGTLAPDLAESITVSEDGITYNIIVRKDARFHDGTPVTARDVVFTIQLVQDPDLKSPLRGNWNDVVVEEIGEHELNIVLEEPYAPFIENFTLGIMPAHLWGELPIEQLPFSQLNTEPIGSGQFMVAEARRDATGLISSYQLTAFTEAYDDPKINAFELQFYTRESDILSALSENLTDATAYISTENLAIIDAEQFTLTNEALPRVFALFLNQNRSSALRDNAVREALSLAINREQLIDSALQGYGVPITSPTIHSGTELQSVDGVQNSSSSLSAADVLRAGDWEQNEVGQWEKTIDNSVVTLSVTIRTSNTPLFNAVVAAVAEDWKALGVEVITEQFEQTGLVQSVIRPRDFEALLFGIDMSRSYDLYPFWHSSQKDDPGLNIAQYTNLSVDSALETARTTQDPVARAAAQREAATTIATEFPAIFLFQPYTTYVTRSTISLPSMQLLGRPSDRFSNTNAWHTRSDVLWPIFQDEL